VSLVLTIVEARNVPRLPEAIGLYCSIEAPKMPLMSTSVVEACDNPFWNAEFPLTLHRRADVAVRLTLLYSLKGEKNIPAAEVRVPALQVGQSNRWVEMASLGKRPGAPELHLQIDIRPPSPEK
jgi:hypothetical protein